MLARSKRSTVKVFGTIGGFHNFIQHCKQARMPNGNTVQESAVTPHKARIKLSYTNLVYCKPLVQKMTKLRKIEMTLSS